MDHAQTGIGNLVIIGHNYYDGTLFSNLNKLSYNDTVSITDLSGSTLDYKVIDKSIIKPNDFSCISQENLDIKSYVTLITCINGTKNRLIVKCIEA